MTDKKKASFKQIMGISLVVAVAIGGYKANELGVFNTALVIPACDHSGIEGLAIESANEIPVLAISKISASKLNNVAETNYLTKREIRTCSADVTVMDTTGKTKNLPMEYAIYWGDKENGLAGVKVELAAN
mgnify:CR=1 FL=1